MALPTIHWAVFRGALAGGASITIAHTVKTGKYPTGAIPEAVEFDMSSGVYTEAPNISIGEYQARDATSIYLSNFDGTGRLGTPHYYGVVARKFHTADGRNDIIA